MLSASSKSFCNCKNSSVFICDSNTSNKFSTNTSNSQTKSSLKATIKWDVINPSRIPQIAKAKDSFENARIAYSI